MSTGRLLVLDDDPTVGQVLVMGAQAIGLEARLCEQAEAFFALLPDWPPSHVAIDLMLPGTSGTEVLRRLAALGSRAHVIICSGTGQAELDDALAEAHRLGFSAVDVLPKPFRLAQLRAVLSSSG